MAQAMPGRVPDEARSACLVARAVARTLTWCASSAGGAQEVRSSARFRRCSMLLAMASATSTAATRTKTRSSQRTRPRRAETSSFRMRALQGSEVCVRGWLLNFEPESSVTGPKGPDVEDGERQSLPPRRGKASDEDSASSSSGSDDTECGRRRQVSDWLPRGDGASTQGPSTFSRSVRRPRT